jgi:hypothetical protein
MKKMNAARAAGVERSHMIYDSSEIVAPDEAERMLGVLLKATQSGNHASFLAPGTVAFQKGITRAMFDSVSRQIAARLQQGYTAYYLTEIRQGEFRVFLWKMSFADRGHEVIARLTLAADGKVAGFLLN